MRKDSKFWNAGGVNVNVGLFGAEITARSAKALIAGALAFATPDHPEGPAPDGTVFRLYDRLEDDWLKWAPQISLPGARTNVVEDPNE